MDKHITEITSISKSNEAPKGNQGASRRQELYQSIVEDIKKQYDYKLSEAEAHEAARNLIDFYRELLK